MSDDQDKGMSPFVVVVTGQPGSAKTTVAGLLADGYELSVHLRGDDFWHFIRQGFVLPYLEGSQRQNEVVIDALSGATVGYARGGYTVVVDAIVGPWLLDSFLARHQEAGVSVHYVVLRPSEEMAVARAVARTGPDDLRDEEPIRTMYGAFSNLGDRESNVVDSSALTPEATVDVVRRGLVGGDFLVPARSSGSRDRAEA
jgi:cytidylate kinase